VARANLTSLPGRQRCCPSSRNLCASSLHHSVYFKSERKACSASTSVKIDGSQSPNCAGQQACHFRLETMNTFTFELTPFLPE
jgi:hypothetical protein